MVETKDSAALFLPSMEALSHGRAARRIGRVRSHKRSLRNQFHLFVNTREDFHSPGGIPPQDYLYLSLFYLRACSRSISLLVDDNSNRHCRRWLESSVSRHESPSRFIRFSLAFPLKNNRRGTSRKSENKTSDLQIDS